MSAQQLTLGLGRIEPYRWQHFVGVANRQLLQRLQELTGTPQRLFVQGPAGFGKTHLLVATAQALLKDGKTAAYLSLRHTSVELLAEFEPVDCLCIDDVGAVAGNESGEKLLFQVYEQQRQRAIVYADRQLAQSLKFSLPDLKSRVLACEPFAIQRPQDEELAQLLRAAAGRRGLVISEDAVTYLLHREQRTPGELMDWLERFDRAAWRDQRQLTLPFIKRVIAERNS